MKKKIFIFWLKACLFLWVVSAHAVIVSDIYTASLPVTDFSVQSREDAVQKALQQVLIKVSGNVEINNLPAIKPILATANAIVDNYSYSNNKQNLLILKIKFNQKSIQQILSGAKQALWGENRPLVLVWLDIANNQGDRILTANSDNDINQSLQDNAKRLGIPIILPAMDLEDINNMPASDLEKLNLTAIKSASKRYNVNTILTGFLYHNLNDTWESNWSLLINKEVIHWYITGKDVNQILTAVTNNVAGELAARLAVLSDSNVHTQIKILITGIKNLNQYNDIVQYLGNLNAITQIKLGAVGPNYVILQITSLNDQEKLAKLITDLGNALVADQTTPNNTDADLIYHWTIT